MNKKNSRNFFKKLVYPALGPFPESFFDRIGYIISIVTIYGLVAITAFILLLIPLAIIGGFADFVFGFLEGIYGADEYGL